MVFPAVGFAFDAPLEDLEGTARPNPSTYWLR